ncbi:restriction endonuclease [Cohnella yongneupensis]|uniref:Restriction endonuclease n=1 Tax=Cohnella yongneupensis TaxID=425006 RepID=A0ABW0R628_9BACL
MSIHTMDGYEFEMLISNLLKNMGFSVEMTPLSGDGGIDLIAYSKEPIFKGKYLVQCKRWNASIGEPVIRDLYGVVLSENANKGIVITNSTFTEKAIEFANNKNIELIDGSLLVQLLDKHKINTLNSTQVIKKRFDEFENFDRDKYQYLKSRVENDRNEKQHYELLRDFYQSYVVQTDPVIIKAGLLDEYINFNEEYIKRFLKKSKKLLEEKKAVQYINGVLYLLKGNLFKSVEIFRDLQLFDRTSLYILLDRYGQFAEHRMAVTYTIKKTPNNSPEIILKNFYMLFTALGFKYGKNKIGTLINDSYQSQLQNFQKDMGTIFLNNNQYHMEMALFKDIQEAISDIDNGKDRKFHLPKNYILEQDAFNTKDYFIKMNFDESCFVTFDQLVNDYWNHPSSDHDDLKTLELLFK